VLDDHPLHIKSKKSIFFEKIVIFINPAFDQFQNNKTCLKIQ